MVVVVVVVQQQNRVTPSPLDFGLWTLDLDFDCDKIQFLNFNPTVQGML